MFKYIFSGLKNLPIFLVRLTFIPPVLGRMDNLEELVPQQKVELNGCLYYVKRLHEVPYLIDECCHLINKEWKRSHTARLRSIDGSSEKFPMSLVLLRNAKKTEVVGHCKISRLSMSSTKVFVETVVIHPQLRGIGLGKFLMNAAENICKSKGIKQIYLSTKGQEGFYGKLGYTPCPPVSLYGCQFSNLNENISEGKPVTNTFFSSNKTSSAPPPPPPPPPPAPKVQLNNNMSSKVFMSKNLF